MTNYQYPISNEIQIPNIQLVIDKLGIDWDLEIGILRFERYRPLWRGFTPHFLGEEVNMYYVYLLKAQNSDWVYIGYTANLKQRMEAHKMKKNFTTSRLGPMELAYYEAYRSAEDAKGREKQLKNYGSALGHLKNRARRSLQDVGVAPCFGSLQKVRGLIPRSKNLTGKEDVG